MNFIGAHISIRNGYLSAAQTAHRLLATAFQYFPKNPRSLSIKHYAQEDAAACKQFCREHGLKSIAHAPYPTNLAVDPGELRDITEQSIINDLHIAEACGSVGLVIHFGKYKGNDPLHGYQNILQLLNHVLSLWQGEALILLENQAGSGNGMGTTLEELVQIRKLSSQPEKIGFCFDTCHAFASGLWNGGNWAEIADKGRALGFFSNLRAVHLNDSRYPSGSLHDRHANVGRGRIGEENLRRVLQEPYLKHIPVILETPASANGTHQEEIRFVQKLAAHDKGC